MGPPGGGRGLPKSVVGRLEVTTVGMGGDGGRTATVGVVLAPRPPDRRGPVRPRRTQDGGEVEGRHP